MHTHNTNNSTCLELGEEHLDDIISSNGRGEAKVSRAALWWSEQHNIESRNTYMYMCVKNSMFVYNIMCVCGQGTKL